MLRAVEPGRIVVEEIPHGGPRWRETLDHRDRILRRPLGLKLNDSDLRGEARQRHFALLEDGCLVAGLVALPPADGSVRLRQMWVTESRQGRGLGRLLLETVAARLADEGIRELVLHAREPVLAFYEGSGFQAEGPTFEEVGIPHRVMRRRLPG